MKKTVMMTLLSDTIFGSGMSIPGAEDIAVKVDEQGAPYLRGSTFKGLLRESVENWLDWEERADGKQVLKELFGAADSKEDSVKDNWHGAEGERRVFVSPLTLAPGQSSMDLLNQRTFTSIDPKTGTVKDGTLRVAACVRKGTRFQGSVTFAGEDQELVENALRCIRYVGTSRTRGFGRVRFELGEELQSAGVAVEGTGSCLRCTLELVENVRVTDLNESHNTYLESKRCISANTLRGVVMNRLARRDEAWFEANKGLLLREVRFTDLIPGNPGEKPAIPVPMGFYEDKLGNNFYSLLVEGDVRPETKRSKLGSFCTLEKMEEEGQEKVRIRGWSPRLGAETRINLDMQKAGGDKPGGLFQTAHLLMGQKAEGMVLFSDKCSEELKERVVDALREDNGALRLGANIHAGFGLCQLTSLRWTNQAPESAAYGYKDGESVGTKVYMMLLSPLMLLDENGEPRGVDKAWLESLLGGVKVERLMCSTTVGQQQGFNRKLGTRLPIRTCYLSGSLFCIECAQPPALERLRELERSGLGEYQEEGWGRVLFLPNLEDVTGRYEQKSDAAEVKEQGTAIRKRRQRAQWLLDGERGKRIQGKLSKRQLGGVQVLLAAAAANPMQAPTMLEERFKDRVSDGNGDENPEKRDLFTPVQNYIHSVAEGEDLPGAASEWSLEERYQLLVDLIKVNRKEGK